MLDDKIESNNIEHDMMMAKLREEIVKKFNEYRVTMDYLIADAPISTLCLPKIIETSLFNHGCLRIYDLFNCDFTKIEGLNEIRIRHLTTCLDKFLSML